ncbi:MAG: TolC family protein [Bacteroidia bacterium]|nr:TolC family protein [Bacteroidia bacterium]
MYEDVQRERVQLTKVDIAEQVSKAYYAVLVSRERIELLEENYRRLDTLLRETRALYENGFAEELDVLRTEVSFNNTRVELQKSLQQLDLATKVLKFQMGMPLNDSLTVEGSR